MQDGLVGRHRILHNMRVFGARLSRIWPLSLLVAGWCALVMPVLAQPGDPVVAQRSDAGADGADDQAGEPGAQAEPSSPPQLAPPQVIASALLLWPEGAPPPPDGVAVLLTVTTEGLAEDLVVETEGLRPDALAAVMEAASELRFAPATRDGQPIPARIRYRFALDTEPSAEPTTPASPSTPTASPPGVDGPATGAQPGAEASLSGATFGARARVDERAPGAASEVQLRGAELTVVPGTFGEPLRVVSVLPGVARTPFGLGFFAVRGASLQNTGFMVDGFPVPLLYHLGAGPAILSSRLVEGLDFYAGGYPVTFGRYTAGIISLRTVPPPTDRFFVEFEVDLLKASTMAVVPFDDGRGTLAVAFRRSYYELILPLITDAVSLSYTDYQLRADYRLSERLAASLFVFGSRDSLQFTQELGQGSTTGQGGGGLSYTFDRVIASMRYRASDEVRLRWAGTAGPSGIDFGQSSPGAASLGGVTTAFRLGQRIDMVVAPNPRLQTTVGFEQNAWINKLSGEAPSFLVYPLIEAPEQTRDSIPVEDRLSELTLAPYIEQVVRPGPFEVTLGMRAEYYRYGDVQKWGLEPRAVVRLALGQVTTVKLASGLFSQAPLPYEVNRSYGNPRLALNRAWQNSAGVELKLPAKLEVDTTLFYNRMWHLTRPFGQRGSVDSLQADLFADDGQGRAYGWELLLRRKVERGLFGWLSYTLSRSERFLSGGRKLPFFFDQTHVLNLAASYKTGVWRFGARFTLATGRPAIDRALAPDGSNQITNTDAADVDIEGSQRIRLPTFHQLDLRVDYDFTWGIMEGSVYLDIINAYFSPNAEGYVYEYDGSRRGKLPGLPFLPTIGLRGVIQ